MRKASGEMRNLLLRCGSFLKRNHTATSFFSGPGDAAPSLRPAMASTSLGFLLVLCTCGLCEDRVITLDGDVENFVVGSNKVFVLSDSRLHQLTLDLALEKSRSVSNETFTNTVNILVPFESNKTLVVCGSWSIGYCEVLDISDISTLLYWESIPAGVSPGVSLVVEIGNGKYLLVGRSKVAKEHSSDALSVSLRNTLHTQKGDIFSSLGPNMTPGIESVSDGDFDFVDGFQLEPRGSIYLFLNIKGRVQMLLLHSKNGKAETFRSLQGAVLECYKNQNQSLVSSAFIPGGSVVRWAGIFSPCNSSGDTVLAVFNIDGSQAGAVSDVCINGQPCKKSTTDKTLTPEAVVFTYRDMTSVAAMRTNNWIFLFIGTGNGQLLKLPLNGSLTPGCPVVLSDGDQKVFPRMLFDPAIQTHIYIAMGNQIRRVPVANCGIHIKLRDCWYAADPSCGWCLSQHRCTFHDQCNSSDWISGYGTQMISVQMVKDPSEQNITVKVVPNLSETLNVSCILEGCGARTPKQCSCILSPNSEDFSITASITIKKEKITEMLLLKNCTSIKESCSQCLSAGCIWSVGKCDWKSPSSNPQMTQDNCTKYASEQNHTKPENLTLKPEEVSIHGRNDAWITGRNLNSVTMVRFKGNLYCSPIESPVTWKDPSGKKIKFHIPSGNKGSVTVCVVTHDGQCHGNATLTYMSQPACRRLKPNISWSSGKRKIFLEGNNLHFMESLSQDNITMIKPNITPKGVFFLTPRVENPGKEKATSVEFRVGNHTVACEESIAYVPDPEFTGFNTAQVGKSMQVTIQVKRNKLNLKESEVRILAIAGEVQEECDSVEIKDSTDRTSVLCSIKDPGIKIDSLEITVGGLTRELKANHNWLVMLIPVVAVFILIGPLVVCLYCKKQKKMAEEMKKHLEEIECGIRNEIRQGFVDMQTEKTELIANVGAIPFLDYKHFASRIFFPEAGPLTGLVIKEIGEESEKEQQDKSCQALSQLIREKHFLTLFIHTLEEQKSFSVKDKCTVASLLTLALHDDLPYLTEVMEELLRSLMDQPSNSQPKLLLRRTESIVEKLLTNWMSVCLYGFLRESVGQPLYLLVSALMQQISKGPVDSVTGKALYTLNEDWLLWQAQDFAPLRLNVLFAVGSEGEVSEPLEVSTLDCDTVDQVKEKILLTFQRKFGFPYSQQLREIDIEYEKDGSYAPLREVESSGVTDQVTMLNTLKHYKILNGTTIKVINKKLNSPLSPQLSVKDDLDFAVKYFHLIDPDEDHKSPEKKKLKVKEIYLNKLVTTKVAVHSYVENLFKTIWRTSSNKAPPAVKYFFDFLDEQAESKKIYDPDVLHIWKTNSLPLRFWVNILKNPQFVFDLEKTEHLDSCLSVVAQAFMDAFSLSDQQLGKHTPTNKLLYAKDVVQYKQEVRAYYKLVREQSTISASEFKAFLQEESKKHENEFNQSAALREMYKFLQRYYPEIEEKLEQSDAPSRLKEGLKQVKSLFEDKKKTTWN